MNNRLRENVIISYRNLVKERYAYQNLQSKYTLPGFLTKEHVKGIRAYFLTYVYPDVDIRQNLDGAFESLDEHIKDPTHLLKLLLDASGLLFKYGFHLTKIFRAGLKALQSFRRASGFETLLYQEALRQNLKPPISTAQLLSIFRSLPYNEVKSFIDDQDILFDTLMDRKLMLKTVGLMKELIDKMNKKRHLYTDSDIMGIKIGLQILEEGLSLVDQLSEQQAILLFNLIKKVEHDALDHIFEK